MIGDFKYILINLSFLSATWFQKEHLREYYFKYFRQSSCVSISFLNQDKITMLVNKRWNWLKSLKTETINNHYIIITFQLRRWNCVSYTFQFNFTAYRMQRCSIFVSSTCNSTISYRYYNTTIIIKPIQDL